MTGDGPRRITRRELLRGAALGGVAAFLAACGATPPSPPPSLPAGTSGPASPSTPASSIPSSALPATPPPSASSSPSAASPTAPPAPTLREQIAGLLIVGFRGASLDEAPWVRTALAEAGLGGVILFDRDQLTGRQRNVVSPAQVRTLARDLRNAARGRAILVSTDQEGGIVTRLGPPHGFPAVASQEKIGSGTPAAARAWATTIATTLADSGLNLNFAPVVDLNVNPRSPAIGALHRSFSANPDVVVRMATIEIDAHRAAAVRTTLKHFPGIGSSTSNTDFGVADVTRTWSRTELEPFRRLIADGHADVVMAGHVVNGQLDRDHPASLSRTTVTGVLRGELAWDGVVVTDDLQAAAIVEKFGADEAVLLALEAGDDLLLFANQQAYDPRIVGRVVDAVAAAVDSGRISEARIGEAWTRVQRMLGGSTG